MTQAFILWTLAALVAVGMGFAATAPVGRWFADWRYHRRAKAVLRHLIRHHERMERRAAA